MKKFATTGISLTGKVRSSNEDAFIYTDDDSRNIQIAIVADGIGSGSYGDIASRLACELFFDYWEKDKAYEIRNSREMRKFLLATLKLVNNQIFNMNLKSQKTIDVPMGTTIVVIVLMEKDVVILHVGDSRCYELSSNNEFILHTRSHTLFNKIADNIAKGNLDIENKREYQNILTKALGIREEISSRNDLVKIIPRAKDNRYLICSDGLAPIVADDTIKNILINSATNQIALNKLISATYIAGASDNLTFVLL